MTDLSPYSTEQERRDHRQQSHRWRYKLIHVQNNVWYVQVANGDVWGVTWGVWWELDNSMGEQDTMTFSTEVVPTSHDERWTDDVRNMHNGRF